jgi:hypothetical protein
MRPTGKRLLSNWQASAWQASAGHVRCGRRPRGPASARRASICGANIHQPWPYVRDWSWQSPVRLRVGHPEGRGPYLVVLEDGPGGRYVGQGIGPEITAERVSEIYADLDVALARNIAHETACQDATPIRTGRCRFCGLLPTEHEVPGDSGATYQTRHVTWGPGTSAVTTAEAPPRQKPPSTSSSRTGRSADCRMTPPSRAKGLVTRALKDRGADKIAAAATRSWAPR